MKEITILLTGGNIGCNHPTGNCLFKGEKRIPVGRMIEQNIHTDTESIVFCQIDTDNYTLSCFSRPPEPSRQSPLMILQPETLAGTTILVDTTDNISVIKGLNLANLCRNRGEPVIVGLLNTELQKINELRTVFRHFVENNIMILPLDVNNANDIEVLLIILENMLFNTNLTYRNNLN